MARGGINIFTSRRVCFHECKYWKQDKNYDDIEKLVQEKAYEGSFYAKEEVSFSQDNNKISGDFMFDKNNVTISTMDSISIATNDIVYFDDTYWIVENVQWREIHKNNEFMRHADRKTYIRMRR